MSGRQHTPSAADGMPTAIMVMVAPAMHRVTAMVMEATVLTVSAQAIRAAVAAMPRMVHIMPAKR
jgi:hypothetical protein